MFTACIKESSSSARMKARTQIVLWTSELQCAWQRSLPPISSHSPVNSSICLRASGLLKFARSICKKIIIITEQRRLLLSARHLGRGKYDLWLIVRQLFASSQWVNKLCINGQNLTQVFFLKNPSDLPHIIQSQQMPIFMNLELSIAPVQNHVVAINT